LITLLLALACGGDAPTAAVDRETFIQTYVDLRVAALDSPNRTISAERRQQILAAHGVTEADLLAFVEAYGEDVDAMTAVWTEVEERLAKRGAGTSTAP
jgi:hypothetical protein